MVALLGNVSMGSSEQHLDRPNPLSFPPQLAARWDRRVSSRDLLSGDSREMKFDLRENSSVRPGLETWWTRGTHLLENM